MICIKINRNTLPIYIGILREMGLAKQPVYDKWFSLNPEVFLFVDRAGKEVTWDTCSGQRNVYDSATQLGEILQVLNEPLPPTPPKIHGYDMVYIKGDYHVKFGCASICIQLLGDVIKQYDGRRITSITLDSGKTISDEQIKSILKYVDYIDDKIITGTTPPEISCDQASEPQDIHNIAKMYVPEHSDLFSVSKAQNDIGTNYRFLSYGEILITGDQYRISGYSSGWTNTNMIGKAVGDTTVDGSTRFIYRRKIS